MLARIAFVTTLLALLLLIDNVVRVFHWVWLTLPLLPLMAWFFDDECAHHRALLLETVETTARELRLEVYQAEEPGKAPKPAERL